MYVALGGRRVIHEIIEKWANPGLEMYPGQNSRMCYEFGDTGKTQFVKRMCLSPSTPMDHSSSWLRVGYPDAAGRGGCRLPVACSHQEAEPSLSRLWMSLPLTQGLEEHTKPHHSGCPHIQTKAWDNDLISPAQMMSTGKRGEGSFIE